MAPHTVGGECWTLSRPPYEEKRTMLTRRKASPPSGRSTKWISLVLWIMLAAPIFLLGGKLSTATSNDAAAWLPRSAEATSELNRARAEFPGSDKLVAVIVYARDGGLTAADRAKVIADRTFFASFGQVSQPIPDARGEAVLLTFPLAGNETHQSDEAKAVAEQIGSGTPDGLQTAFTGSAGAVKDIIDAFSGIDTALILVTVAVVAVLLLITYRSPILWLVPLISVGIASQLAAAIVYLFAKAGSITVNGQSQGILTVLVFGAGTDYALLLISRYREELRRHEDRHEAMAIALRSSLPAILASGATVAISLLCLLFAELNNNRGLGPVGAIGILSALVVMTTLLPAILVVGGRWLFWPFVPRFSKDAAGHDIAEDHGLWARIAGFVGRRSRVVWLTTAVALGALAFGMLGLHTGQTSVDQYTRKVGSVTGAQLVAKHFPAGTSLPADIVARADKADAVRAAAAGVTGVATVADPVISADGQWVRITAVLADPPDTTRAKDTIAALRTAVHAVPGAGALVGGQTAIVRDTETAAHHDTTLIIPIILLVVFLILVALLRAVVAPLLLLGSVVLSFATAMGAASLIFHAIGHPRIDLSTPLFGFLFLVALGVDYTIFLMTRAREETAKFGARNGMLHALTVTGGVITGAGIVLAATFAVLGTLPITALLQLGIIVAVGVLMDTLIIRTLLVPAVSIDIGRRIWWPSRLATATRPSTPAAATSAGAVDAAEAADARR
jgi:RND superfamily putative drug exporter